MIPEPVKKEILSCGSLGEVKSLILKKGVDVTKTDMFGYNLLHIFAQDGKWDVCKYLIDEKSVSPEVVNIRNGYTPLIIATRASNFLVVKSLVEEYDCNPMGKDRYENTALHYSSRLEDNDILNYFVEEAAGTEINDQNQDGNTPLHEAMIFNSYENIKLLLRNGSDPTISNNEDKSPESMCQESGSRRIKALFLGTEVVEEESEKKEEVKKRRKKKKEEEDIGMDYVIVDKPSRSREDTDGELFEVKKDMLEMEKKRGEDFDKLMKLQLTKSGGSGANNPLLLVLVGLMVVLLLAVLFR